MALILPTLRDLGSQCRSRDTVRSTPWRSPRYTGNRRSRTSTHRQIVRSRSMWSVVGSLIVHSIPTAARERIVGSGALAASSNSADTPARSEIAIQEMCDGEA